MRIHLQYGTTGLDVDLPTANVQVIAPRFVAGLPDEQAAFLDAVRHPMEAAPLASIVRSHERVAIVIPDITRPLPTDRLLPWMLQRVASRPGRPRHDRERHGLAPGEHAGGAPGDGRSGRLARYRVVNHDSHDPATMVRRAWDTTTSRCHSIASYVEADRRIVLGFIEPHFMAGFSGGYKGVFPAVADIDVDHALPRRADDRACAQHVGRARGQSDAGSASARWRAGATGLSASTSHSNRQRADHAFFCGAPLAAHDAGLQDVARDRDGASASTRSRSS